MNLPKLFLVFFSLCAVASSAFASDLFKAVEKDDADAVAESLKKGSDINEKDQFGRTALHKAAAKGDKEIIEILIKSGADINAKDVKGDTPLHAAAWKENEEIIKFLVEKKADPNAANSYGQTAQEIVLMIKAMPSPINSNGNRNDVKALASYYDFKAKNNDMEKNDPGIEGYNLTLGKYANNARESYFLFDKDMKVTYFDLKSGELKGTYSVEGRDIYVKLKGMSKRLRAIDLTILKDRSSGILFCLAR